MTGPRLSITLATAFTDPRLKGKALNVLGILGSHTDRHGWCTRSQVKMAKQLGCVPSTINAAVKLLVELGYIEQRRLVREDNGDRASEYRVLLDDVRPAEFITDDDELEEEEDGVDPPPVDIPTPPYRLHRHPRIGSGSIPIRTIPLSNDEEREARGARVGVAVKETAGEKAARIANEAWADTRFITSAWQVWPDTAAEVITRTYPAWQALTSEEQEAALAAMPAAIASMRAGRRKGGRRLFNYLEERAWKNFHLVAGGGAALSSVTLAARTLPWFAMFWRLVAAGRPVKVMFENMQRGTGYAVRVADVPSDAETGALVKIGVAVDGRPTAEMAAWTAAMARHGISFTPLSIGMPFVWVPSRWPPGHEQARAG
ncbi:helix-turn-helix domain-containing protein [Kaistia adipata]|uniref:helix-turn-helix domain-containing protein n=1 Tax=Kaistia adipata TaxID=166954 RepID=UPI00040E9243|nr:helix-turn-helix domain-containing protein [Kaistia adipata]